MEHYTIVSLIQKLKNSSVLHTLAHTIQTNTHIHKQINTHRTHKYAYVYTEPKRQSNCFASIPTRAYAFVCSCTNVCYCNYCM